MGKSAIIAAILTLLGGVAFAEHAISLEPEAAPAASQEPSAAPAKVMAPEAKQEPQAPSPATVQLVQPAPKVEVTLPSDLDVYMVPAATHEVCTTRDWGYGEVETDCRVKPIPVRREDPRLRGICITRYGQRVCH